jgi:transposase-like protein
MPSRNVLATKLFVEGALKYCDGMPTFIVDSAPWLTVVLKEFARTGGRVLRSRESEGAMLDYVTVVDKAQRVR